MTRSDVWNTRACVAQYLLYKDKLNLAAKKQAYRLGIRLYIDFFLPMPASWSKKKKELMRSKPHDAKPDLDNLVKAFQDALTTDDTKIWETHARKYWGDRGMIVVNGGEA